MTVPVPLPQLIDSIPSSAALLFTPTDFFGYPSVWIIFQNATERTHFLTRWAYTWVSLPDRSAKLDYQMEWYDVAGYGLQLATSRPPVPAGR